MKKAKASGTRFEYRVAHYLRKRSWIVFRMAGSHTCADLIAYRNMAGKIQNIWVQCKASGKPNLTTKEKLDLFYGADHLGVKVYAICREPNTWKFIIYMMVNHKFIVSEDSECLI